MSFFVSFKRSYSIDSQHFNVMIVGGGLVGCAMAAALNIGLWEKILSTERPNPFRKMIVWDGVAKGRIVFDAQDLGLPFMGYVVENEILHQSLMSYLDEESSSSSQIHLMEKTNLEALDLKQESYARLLVKSSSDDQPHQRDITCDLLIGADGAHSSVRRLSELESVGWKYHQSAIVCTLHHHSPPPLMTSSSNESHVAWQRFLPSGPIAMLPLSSTASSLVWTLPSHLAHRMVSLTEKEFAIAVNMAFRSELSDIHSMLQQPSDSWILPVSENNMLSNESNQQPNFIVSIEDASRAVIPLSMHHTPFYSTRNTVVIGDAARRVHPLAGQGFNMGIGDVVQLTRILRRRLESGSPLGDSMGLEEYARSRHRETLPIMMAIDGCQKLFGTDNKVISYMRSLGLDWIQSLPRVKGFFMKGAMENGHFFN